MIKTIGEDKEISITDQIRFILTTTNSVGCFINPYKISKVVIYYASREFTQTTVSEYTKNIYDKSLEREYQNYKKIACENPTQENINDLNLKKNELEKSKFNSSFFYKDAIPVKIFGGNINETGELFPAWINPDFVPEDLVSKINGDNLLYQYKENNSIVEGKFVLEWNPIGCREGDYFICWSWTPNLAGDELSNHMMFSLGANTKLNSIPTHQTPKDKYQILMDRYLPSMFKNLISQDDLSPYVLQELNYSVAKGFTFIEDLANQIIDMLDANMIQEQSIPLLSNIFNLKLKSDDPTLWRKQTKKAIQNFKQKGTLKALKSALSDGGMNLIKLTKLWQVVSKYTYQDYFEVKDNSNEFILSKGILLPVDVDNFELFYKNKNSDMWESLGSNYVHIEEISEKFVVTWRGDIAEPPINLGKGDAIRILYQTSLIPNIEEQNIENYIRNLDLMDQRNERDQIYPPKNWNTRVIEEDDPVFDLVIPVKHPLKDNIIWGRVRTEFPYSENVYNMEEYNGSTRDSFDPCNIDKNFIDSCSDCQSSMISLNIEVEKISKDRFFECEKIIEEFVPFHSIIHSINYVGSNIEFIKSPIEEIKILIRHANEDVLISGNAQHIFNRSIPRRNFDLIKRNLLAQVEDVTGDVVGIARNTSLFLFSPSFSEKSELENFSFLNKINSFDQINIDTSDINNDPLLNSNLLEILPPFSNSGAYSISKVSKNYLEVISRNLYAIPEPLDKSQFEFRVSNKIHEQTSVSIKQDDFFIFFDTNYDFHKFNILSQKDIDDQNLEDEFANKIIMNDSINHVYDILEILPDNRFVIRGPLDSDEFNLEKINISWKIIDKNSNEICSGNKGVVDIKKMGLVDLDGVDVKKIIDIGDYMFYNEIQYKIKYFSGFDKFYIENYDDGDVGGIDISVYRRIIENCVGQLDYNGLELTTDIDYEQELSIQNGKSPPEYPIKNSLNKENFLILINSNYYSITEIDHKKITLNGPYNEWTTLGTNVNFTIYRFIKQPVSIPETLNPPIPGHDFDEIKRMDNEVITYQVDNSTSFIASKILNDSKNSNIQEEFFVQEESINYNIEYKEE